jgi:hypothetical protein
VEPPALGDEPPPVGRTDAVAAAVPVKVTAVRAATTAPLFIVFLDRPLGISFPLPLPMACVNKDV